MKKRLPAMILVLGTVSLLTDFSSEMIYPLLPLYLTVVLGAGAVSLGVIEGVAESTAALLKVVSGIRTDQTGRRKPLVVVGYTLSNLVRPLIGLATIWPAVLVLRFADRVGKGLRTSPRDALIADVTSPEVRGRAYGLHRAMDNAGAVLGPLAAMALLSIEHFPLRVVFLLSAIPAALVVLAVTLGLRERRPAPAMVGGAGRRIHRAPLGRSYWRFLVALLVFTLGNSSDAFLLLHLSQLGVQAAWIAGLWALHNGVKMLFTYGAGRLSDRLGRRNLMVAGWLIYALVYLGFAQVTSTAGTIAIFLAYGLYFACTEPVERAWISDLIPAQARGTAFGYYHGTIGLAALPASLLFGWLFQTFGAETAFQTGALLAVAATLLLMRVPTAIENPDAV